MHSEPTATQVHQLQPQDANPYFPGEKSDLPGEVLTTKEQLESLYDVGQKLYQQRKFAEATCIFIGLAMQDMFNARYTFALGACLQAQSALEAACQAYAMCRSLEPANPLAALHLGDCQMQLGNREEALRNYRNAVGLIDTLSEQPAWATRARGLIDLIAGTTNTCHLNK
jgi:type III secretion system low calcium response chaperone LcrH/SycD